MKNNTDKAGTGIQTKNYSLLSNTKYMMKGLLKYDRKLIVLLFYSALTMTSMWYLWTFITKFVVAMLERGLKSGTHNLEPLIQFIVIAFLLQAFLMGCNVIAENYLDYHITYVRLKYAEERIAKTLSLDYEMLETPSVLDLMKKAEKAAEGGEVGIEGMLYNIQAFLQMTSCMILGAGIIFTLNPWLVLVVIVIGALQSFYYQYTIKVEKKLTWDQMGSVLRKQNYLKNVTRDFAYAKDIRLFSLHKMLMNKQKTVNNEQHSLLIKSKNQWIKNDAVFGTLTAILNTVIYGYVIKAVLYDGMGIANLSFYVLGAVTFNRNVIYMLNTLSRFKNCSDQMSDFRTFMELSDESEAREYRPLPKTGSYEFTFENVSFKYPGTDTYAIQDLNLTIHAGKRLAVVGLNGAGKTTFIKLLLRIYDVTQGKILMNGVDIREYDKKEYYKLFSPVFQNVEIFAFPISENISMNKPENTDIGLVEDCIGHAGLGDKIKHLPNGMNTQLLKVLYDDGIDLSGGERQKLALARALYKNAPLIVLDEPTAAMDALSENQLYMDFDKLIAGRTSVYISHRLSSTRFCDAVAMFEDGKMIEYGTHESLMRLNGSYAKMFHTQAQYYEEQKEEGEYAYAD